MTIDIIRGGAVLSLVLVISVAAAAPVHAASVLTREPSPDAPQGVKDIRVLIGDWECGSSNLQPDGTWKETSYRHKWRWYYTLEGQAVQDYWLPDKESPGTPGTNLRMYDRESNSWYIAWSTLAMSDFDSLSATFDGEHYVLTGHKEAANGRPEHDRRITFHNISDDHFDWKYEAMSANTKGEWREVARLSCDRQ